MNGQSGVALSNTYLRVYRMRVVTAGSGGVNAGIIYVGTGSITNGKPATVYALIPASVGQTQMCIYTVPAGYTAYLTKFYVTANGQKGVDFLINTRASTANASLQAKYSGHIQENYQYEYTSPLVITEKTDIDISAKVTATSADVAAGFELIMIQN